MVIFLKKEKYRILSGIAVFFLVFTLVFTISVSEIKADSTLIAYYDFNGTLTDSLSGSVLNAFGTSNDGNNHNNATSGFASDAGAVGDKTYWYWTSSLARGGGFYIDINGSINSNYSIGIRFALEQTGTGYKKIIDYKNMASDDGFYFLNNYLNFYPLGTATKTSIADNAIVDIIATRDGSTNKFIAYFVKDGQTTEELNVTDSGNSALPAVVDGKTRLGFFFDDTHTLSEAATGGKVYSIKVWNGPITAEEIPNAMDATAILQTNDASGIASTSATLNGNITDSGSAAVTGRGFVYSSIDSTPIIGESDVLQVASGSGTGSFNVSQSGLTNGTKYYYQAYATNSVGTSYGGVKSFTTLGSNVATVTSGTYTVSTGGTASETITGVPHNTSKASFLASLTKGNASQTWNSSGISDPAVSGNTLVVTAQDGSTTVTYTITVNSASENTPAPKIFTKDEMVANNLTILEQVRLYGATSSGFVEMLYDNILNRVYDVGGYSNWTEHLLQNALTGPEVAYLIIFGDELAPTISTLSDNDFIAFLYRIVLDRPYDEPGYANWQQQIDLGMTREELVNHFLSSDEFIDICKLFNVTP